MREVVFITETLTVSEEAGMLSGGRFLAEGRSSSDMVETDERVSGMERTRRHRVVEITTLFAIGKTTMWHDLRINGL